MALLVTDADRTPPQDIDAEQSTLGSCLLSSTALREALDILDPANFYRPAHQIVFECMGRMEAQGHPVDAITLTGRLREEGELNRIGGVSYIHELAAAVVSPASVGYYAEIVEETALRRRLASTGVQITQMAYGGEGETSEAVEKAVSMIREVRDHGRRNEQSSAMDILDFVQVEDSYDWIIPGLLERGDRLLLTATEGGGKSMLLRQIGVAASAGIHPFETWRETEPSKVLILDCENTDSQSRRKFMPMLAAAEKLGRPVQRGQFSIECRPQGLDLSRAPDRAYVMRHIEAQKPDILIIGPVYRLHAGNPNDEELARKVSVVIDEIRATAGCAVLMECHSPHGNGLGPRDLRPLGSSLWKRWPEFGYGLRPVEDERSAAEFRAMRFVPWRGARDERAWPHFLRAQDALDPNPGPRFPWASYRPADADIHGFSATGAVM